MEELNFIDYNQEMKVWSDHVVDDDKATSDHEIVKTEFDRA